MPSFDPVRRFLVVPALTDEAGTYPELPAGVTNWVGNLLRPDVYLILTTDPISELPRAGVDFDAASRARELGDARTLDRVRELLAIRLNNDGSDDEIRALQGLLGATRSYGREQLGRWSIRGQ